MKNIIFKNIINELNKINNQNNEKKLIIYGKDNFNDLFKTNNIDFIYLDSIDESDFNYHLEKYGDKLNNSMLFLNECSYKCNGADLKFIKHINPNKIFTSFCIMKNGYGGIYGSESFNDWYMAIVFNNDLNNSKNNNTTDIIKDKNNKSELYNYKIDKEIIVDKKTDNLTYKFIIFVK
jgi:hypothetical protein